MSADHARLRLALENARALYEAGRTRQAIHTLELLLPVAEGDDIHGEVLYYIGYFHGEEGDSDTAVMFYRRALLAERDAAGWFHPLFGLAGIHQARGDVATALALHLQCLRVCPAEQVDVRGLLHGFAGMGYFFLDDFALARHHLQAAASLLGAEADAEVVATTWRFLGYAHAELGQVSAARRCLERALDLAADSEASQEIVDFLQTLAAIGADDQPPVAAVGAAQLERKAAACAAEQDHARALLCYLELLLLQPSAVERAELHKAAGTCYFYLEDTELSILHLVEGFLPLYEEQDRTGMRHFFEDVLARFGMSSLTTEDLGQWLRAIPDGGDIGLIIMDAMYAVYRRSAGD